MAVYKRGETWWYSFLFAGQRIQESAKTHSKTVAKRAMLGLGRTGGIASNGSGDYVIASNMDGAAKSGELLIICESGDRERTWATTILATPSLSAASQYTCVFEKPASASRPGPRAPRWNAAGSQPSRRRCHRPRRSHPSPRASRWASSASASWARMNVCRCAMRSLTASSLQ